MSSLTREDLSTFHLRWIRPDNARIFVVSARPLAELTPLLDARFGDWEAPTAPKGRKAFVADLPAPKPRIVLIDRPQSPQSLILGGVVLPVTGRDLVAFNAANEVIGNGFLSRINQDIRETRGWSYGLNGRVTLAEQRSPYIVTAPVQADRTGESIRVLMDQYETFLGDKGVTAAEARRTIAEGGAYVNNQRVSDPSAVPGDFRSMKTAAAGRRSAASAPAGPVITALRERRNPRVNRDRAMTAARGRKESPGISRDSAKKENPASMGSRNPQFRKPLWYRRNPLELWVGSRVCLRSPRDGQVPRRPGAEASGYSSRPSSSSRPPPDTSFPLSSFHR